MVTPFYNAVKGTTAGTPGTGAFTPNAASSGFRAWSTVPAGWIGLVRYDDGSADELTYSYWNGTTLSRASTQFYDSSTGSQLTLTSAATAAMIVDGAEVMSHLGGTPWRGLLPTTGQSTLTAQNISTITALGTAAAPTLSGASFIAAQPRTQYTSATTANAQAGFGNPAGNVSAYSTTAGLGGFEYTVRFGATTLPTGPRLFMGLAGASYSGSTAEPSALATNLAIFGLDSTDTNIQLISKTSGGSFTKVDTGIPLVANGWHEATVWAEPGGGAIYGLLIRLDTGAIWLGKSTTNLPSAGVMNPNCVGGLNGTNTGTAFVLQFGGVIIRSGS